jgi:hypothetical protein
MSTNFDLTPKSEARQIASRAAWCLREQELMAMLTDAGCTPQEIAACMRMEVS